ncbi:MAG TPA: EAL domain-containing protein [Burkholderiales bacterium]|nr:EAL domain-containing protein [Burkholderiales bacterium]
METVKVLLLEDDDSDALLLTRTLGRIEPSLGLDVVRAKTREEFERMLAAERPALIISDYTIPGFDGLAALGMAQEQATDVPFIFVSGTIGEERAIDALKNGASDYVLKGNMRRLVPAIQRALQDAALQRARRDAEQALSESEKRYESLVELSPDGIFLVTDGVISFANKMATKIYRAETPGQIVGKPYVDLVQASSTGEATMRLRRFTGRPENLPYTEQKHRRLDGTEVHVELASTSIMLHGRDSLLVVTRDITERKRYESQLRYQATHDGLTGLANRNLFSDHLPYAVAAARRHGHSAALAFVDLDRFKFVNDSFGHESGDAVLKDVSRRLVESVRDSDMVARLSGDEFVILFEDIDSPEIVTQMMERVLPAIAQPLSLRSEEILLTCSIGISVYPTDAEDAGAMLRNADTAMYRAKEKGGNAFEYYTADMNSRSKEHLVLSAGLRRALERNEFFLHYQPQMDLATGRLSGMEALVRWNHPEQGVVPPGKFIPICEQTGLIVPLGQWVLKAACEATKKLVDKLGYVPQVSVNVSARQFRRTDLVQYVENVLRAVDFPPESLELELTESMVAQDAVFAAQTMRSLKSLGVRIAIDDFGTGYSSLNYLKRYPVDRLKIDQSFVNGIASDPDDETICKTIISLAHNLGLVVIAEGVENDRQLGFLQQYGCDEVQGYLIGRPVALEELRGRFAAK